MLNVTDVPDLARTWIASAGPGAFNLGQNALQNIYTAYDSECFSPSLSFSTWINYFFLVGNNSTFNTFYFCGTSIDPSFIDVGFAHISL